MESSIHNKSKHTELGSSITMTSNSKSKHRKLISNHHNQLESIKLKQHHHNLNQNQNNNNNHNHHHHHHHHHHQQQQQQRELSIENNDYEQQPRKKQKKLDFSIESLMRPTQPKQQELFTSSSPATSISGSSVTGSPEIDSCYHLRREEEAEEEEDVDHEENDDNDHHDDDDDDYDERNSTPISPGGDTNCNLGSGRGRGPVHVGGGLGGGGGLMGELDVGAENNNNKINDINSNTTYLENNNNGRLPSAECLLDNKDMWDKFHSLNTEMIITKTGRRMFPVMKVQFRNLNPNARYSVAMDIVPVDNKRYRYAYHKSCWQVAGKADPSAENRLYMHPDSPFNGDLLSRQVISFEKVKLTNNEMDKSGHIILNSMHKYQPRVYLIELKTPAQATIATNNNQQMVNSQQQPKSHHLQASTSKTAAATTTTSPSYYNNNNSPASNHYHQNQNQNNTNHSNNNNHHQHQQQPQLQSDIEGYRTFVFPETVFTAVTAYQNQLITKMKIDKNPFAKGFRDSSRLSDLDRSDPFDYMASLGSSAARFISAANSAQAAAAAAAAAAGQPGSVVNVAGGLLDGSGGACPNPTGLPGSGPSGSHMDAYQSLLGSAAAANNPWYSAAAVAAAAGGANPFNPIGAAACSTAQAAQLQATQMWLAAFSACLNGSTTPVSNPSKESHI